MIDTMETYRYKVMKNGQCVFETNNFTQANYYAIRYFGFIEEQNKEE